VKSGHNCVVLCVLSATEPPCWLLSIAQVRVDFMAMLLFAVCS